ncbi:MAG TPA: hypothetical protein EYG73_04930 [Arcobacter sp.]|nr:hypothetical protein [Arcobacter sp.]
MGKKNSLKIVEITTYNKEYKEKMLSTSQSTQETPWGFQEISLKNQSKHYITSIKEYQNLIKLQSNQKIWKDNKVHIIYFSKGMYEIPIGKTYFVLTVPSQTIIEGEGMGKTIFKAVHEIDKNDKFQFRRLFNLEYAKYDVVVRGISFYNETKDNKWGLFYANGSINRENYLFENIEFDDTFGAIGKRNYNSNFITFRGLKKRIGKTTERINKFFTVPIPLNYQFHTQNSDNIELAGQIGVRKGNSVVFHDCELGDNISATIDIYSNYVEIVGVKFINPLHDHAIKNPQGNHLYIHDSSFELRYEKKIIEGTGYWSPTFFTHEITAESTISLRKNYHFKNVTFKRVFQTILGIRNGIETAYVESEPFTIYDENEKRINNISGDMIWEDIFFEGYSAEHEIVGYPNVQTAEGYKALNYTNHIAQSAQMKAGNNNSHGSYEVAIAEQQNTSKEDVTGVYSWGNRQDGTIDYPRDNRLFIGTKLEATSKPYIQMYSSSMKESYNSKL